MSYPSLYCIQVSILFCTYCRRAIHWYSSDSIRWDKIAQWFFWRYARNGAKLLGYVAESKFPLFKLSMGTCGNALSSYVCILCLKKLYKQVQKTFVKKWGRVGLEEHVHWNNTKFANKIVGWCSILHAPTSWGWGSIFAIFTSWVQHYFEFGRKKKL